MVEEIRHVFVVLAYKESEFLEECIKSVGGQGSEVAIFTTTPNGTIRELAEKYELELKVGEHTSIGGDFDAALRYGVELGADLVTIAHQDDVYEKEYGKTMRKTFRQFPQAQIIFSDYFEIRNKKREAKNKNLKIKRILLTPLRSKRCGGKKWAKRFVLKFGNAICCPAVTFNMHKVRPPLFECEMRCDIDWFVWEKLSRREGAFILVPERLMGHRVHEGSETTATIADDARSREDYEMFRKFWPKMIAKRLTKFYKKSEKSNEI